jgi:type F conjugative transfer system protein TrbI
MTDDKGIRDERPERDETEQDDPTITRRVAGEEERVPDEASHGATPPTSGGIAQQIWRRIQEERSRPKRVEINTRGQNNMDRSKALLVLGTAVVLVGFAFLALFSTSGTEKRAQERRTKPSLGRPESSAQRAGPTGSAVPLLSADQTGADQNGDQLSPDDILATSRRGQTPKQQDQQPPKGSDQYALSNAPTFNDPALDAYKRQNAAYTPPPAPPPPAIVPQPTNDSDGLKKTSLVFVRNTTAAGVTNASLSSPAAQQQVLIERKGPLLPTGSRLVARLQTAVSSAVKTPVIAVIEYNYERDGEIVIPAGTKAIGQLAQANQNGQVGLRFTTLQMPDGGTENIEGSAVTLDYGPLKGTVNGQNRAKRALVRSLTGIGSMATYLVGGSGYGGLTGPVDQSILLRERIASNIGLAGEQELMGLAYNQNIVVTLAGNTRFYIVLQEPSAARQADIMPAVGTGSRMNIASADGQSLPTAAELRELISLKDELNRMYREVAAPRTSEPPPNQ